MTSYTTVMLASTSASRFSFISILHYGRRRLAVARWLP